MKIKLGKKKQHKIKCTKCGKFAVYIPQYKRYYCTNCELYTEKETDQTETLTPKTVHKDLPPPPPVGEETSLGESTLEETPVQQEVNREAAIKQQKDADMEYYKKLYGDIMLTAKENTRLFYGILSETKTLNFQLAQLIEMVRQGFLIKK